MSKAAFTLLVLLSLAGAALLFVPLPEALVTMAKVLFAVLLGAFMVALALGRRFKFDPVLRSSIR